ncbi:hypothetical protein P3X46_031510 [Hevea brasiliensis]|uniref:Movement protein n=1 Tax=Hevea brasiliensis TaxID=3981 RepID=A0ABQ9KKK0_HEVBR|nr:hypothetical protein P3X46_031510 [Hevea brasiliensis]
MDRLFSSLSGSSKSAWFEEKENKKLKNKNKEVLLLANIENNLNNWKLPPISPNLIYKSNNSFKFKFDYVIKTVEQATPIHEGLSSRSLFSEELLKRHQKEYSFLHIGMVQVALKPATRLGLNTSALICVRDKRHNNFNDSLLGIVESSLCDGPIYFSCYPNFTISIRDPHVMKALSLDIKTSGYDMLPRSENIILIYRIHYKAMNTVVPNLREETTKLISPKGTTTFFVTDLEKGNLVVPKSIEWEQVKLPKNWILEEAIPPKKEESTDLESIIETNNGTVAISFARSRSRNLFSGRSVCSEPILPRSSLSGIESLERINSMNRLSSIGTQKRRNR